MLNNEVKTKRDGEGIEIGQNSHKQITKKIVTEEITINLICS